MFLGLKIIMSNVINTIEHRNSKYDFKLAMVLAFVLVAISFFSVGYIYANSHQTDVLIKLLVIFGGINSCLVYYLCKKLNRISNT